jgi:hypothetical protein
MGHKALPAALAVRTVTTLAILFEDRFAASHVSTGERQVWYKRKQGEQARHDVTKSACSPAIPSHATRGLGARGQIS